MTYSEYRKYHGPVASFILCKYYWPIALPLVIIIGLFLGAML